ncbi:hypothetical protein [Trichothermofontia sp.]
MNPNVVTNLPPFRDRSLLQQALTHRSYVNDYSEIGENNERLKFLGDSVWYSPAVRSPG